ncbi:MAG: polysaccharide deacetylase family protein [Lachnospiraceae bacterium]|nr:polysaccharide deacetylase family protein [Lachnospiraceae bacterium]
MDHIRAKYADISVSSRKSIVYDATQEIREAEANYTDEQFEKKTEKVEGYKASQHKISLIIAGLTTPAEMQKILDLLDEYSIKATFACEGISASEIPDTVREIKDRGNILANYGMSGEEHWEELDDASIIDTVARTQAIIKGITGEYPEYAIGNSTVVNDNILYLTACANIDHYISSTGFLNPSSFKDFGEALGFVEKTAGGSIICFKIDDNLDETEYEPFEVDERPADDKQASVKRDEQTVKMSAAESIELLLEALYTTETAVVPLDDLHNEPDPSIDKMFSDMETAADYEVERSEMQDPGFLGGALFIGDSLTLALSYYPVVDENAIFCAYKSITPTQFVNNLKVSDADGRETAVWDEVCSKNPEKIYILLGTNALASGSNKSFIVYYERLIDMLKEQFPDIPVYVEGLPPVTKEVSDTRITLNNGRIRKINVEIAKMATEKNCYYIDLYSALADSEKALPKAIAQDDGIHMNQEGCQMWIDHLLTHKAKEGKK